MAAVRRIRADGLDANLSVKPTAIGLDIDEDARPGAPVADPRCRAGDGRVRADRPGGGPVRARPPCACTRRRWSGTGTRRSGSCSSRTCGSPPTTWRRWPRAAPGSGWSRVATARRRGTCCATARSSTPRSGGTSRSCIRTATDPADRHPRHGGGRLDRLRVAPQRRHSHLRLRVPAAVRRPQRTSSRRWSRPATASAAYVPFGGNWLNWLLLCGARRVAPPGQPGRGSRHGAGAMTATPAGRRPGGRAAPGGHLPRDRRHVPAAASVHRGGGGGARGARGSRHLRAPGGGRPRHRVRHASGLGRGLPDPHARASRSGRASRAWATGAR